MRSLCHCCKLPASATVALVAALLLEALCCGAPARSAVQEVVPGACGRVTVAGCNTRFPPLGGRRSPVSDDVLAS